MEENKEKINIDGIKPKSVGSFPSPFLQNKPAENRPTDNTNPVVENILPAQEAPVENKDYSKEIKSLPVEEKIGKKEIGKKIFKITITLVALIIIAVVAIIGLRVIKSYLISKNDTTKIVETMPADSNLNIVDENIVKAETATEELAVADDSAVSSSENYRIRKINIGGDIAIMADNSENKPVEIYSVRNEMFMTKDGKEIKVLIYWKTNKLTVSEIKYEKINGTDSNSKLEKDFDVNHSLVLSDLDLNSTYVYTVKAKDRWGNEIVSDQYSVYTGSLPASIFELIGREFGELFKWVLKN